MSKTKLTELAKQLKTQSQPPVDRWQPKQQGDIDIRIDAHGFWFHEGAPIERENLVILFASILWHENNQHYLKTPAEQLKIEVEDVPFVVQQADLLDGAWVVTTNVHEQIILSEQNPVQLRQYQGQWLPYIKVRYDLWARVNRSVYYQWVESVLEQQQAGNKDENQAFTLSSGDYQFKVAEASSE